MRCLRAATGYGTIKMRAALQGDALPLANVSGKPQGLLASPVYRRARNKNRASTFSRGMLAHLCRSEMSHARSFAPQLGLRKKLRRVAPVRAPILLLFKVNRATMSKVSACCLGACLSQYQGRCE